MTHDEPGRATTTGPSVPQTDAPTSVLRPPSRWPRLDLGEIWGHRELLVTLTQRDVKLRYRQTALGIVWVVGQPLLAAAILGFVFGQIAGVSTSGVPHVAFAFAGVLAWSALTAALSRGAPAVVQNVALISKVFFPRLLLPLAASLASLVDAAVGLCVAALVAYFAMGALSPAVVLAPAFILVAALLGAGVGLGAAALMVPYRDVQHILPVFVQLVLFVSPVAYPVAAVPADYRWIVLLNPLAGLCEGLRWALLGLPPTSWRAVAYAVVASAAAFAGGVFVFRALEQRFADVI